MGFIESEDRRLMEMEELKNRMLLACADLSRRKDQEDFQGSRLSSSDFDVDDHCGQKLVCVTSGVSFLGLAIVNRLLRRGYSVRIIVHTEGDFVIELIPFHYYYHYWFWSLVTVTCPWGTGP